MNLTEQIITSLGEPTDNNEYIIIPINGEWWVEHKHVGSGEPLSQFLNNFLKDKP